MFRNITYASCKSGLTTSLADDFKLCVGICYGHTFNIILGYSLVMSPSHCTGGGHFLKGTNLSFFEDVQGPLFSNANLDEIS